MGTDRPQLSSRKTRKLVTSGDPFDLVEVAGDLVAGLEFLGALEEGDGFAVLVLGDEELGLADLGVGLEGLEAAGALAIEDGAVDLLRLGVVLTQEHQRLAVERIKGDDLFE